MSSRLIVNQIRHTGASADAITMDASGNVTFPANATCSGTATGFGGGKILQVIQTFKNDTASTNSGTFADISGLTVTITPSATSSKILYTGGLYLAGSSSESNFRLKRTIGGTATDIGVSSVLDDDADGSFAHGGGSRYDGHAWEFLDSPNTTSAITYGIRWRVHSGTTYLNRTWDANWFHGASAITVMEVGA
tara:strand:- start:2638 stop:3216 length:579 start_codon:yes stop_codon:yes gene_type:complete